MSDAREAEIAELRAELASSEKRRKLLASYMAAVKGLLKKGRTAEALDNISDLDQEIEAEFAAYLAAHTQT